MTNNSEKFYDCLLELQDFNGITDINNYKKMPDDWYIAITDVIGSTKAIEDGRYKEVNTIGASSIIAILNLDRSRLLPFIFGGDGAVICIPPSFYSGTRKALVGIKKMASEGFGMDIRVGLIQVKDIHASGNAVLVAKYRVSKDYSQAFFTGGGIPYAESRIKEIDDYNLDLNDELPEADFDGLQCRWENIPASRGEIVSIIVQAFDSNMELSGNIYKEVLDKINDLYGEDKICRPINTDILRLSLDNKILNGEIKVKYFNRNAIKKLLFNIYQKLSAVVGELLFKSNLYIDQVHWGKYKDEVVANTDYKKFDDQLRFVLNGSSIQRQKLKEFLEDKYVNGKLVYGIHHAPQALITCLIFDYNGQHIHFIDGDNGGYALAAKELKLRLKRLKQVS